MTTGVSASIRVEPTSMKAGADFELRVTQHGDGEVVWGESVTMLPVGAITDHGGFCLIGGPPGRAQEPRSYGPNDQYEIDDIGYRGSGTLRLRVPANARPGTYKVQSKYVAIGPDGGGSSRHIAETTFDVS